MRNKGFTLVELLVVIAIIALLMGILMPALARVRQIAHRMVCGTNLSGIGKAMLIYANDYDEAYPVAGPIGTTWTTQKQIANWQAVTPAPNGLGGTSMQAAAYGRMYMAECTIGSCLYLLVKYADLTPKQFLCKGDVGVSEFTLSSDWSSQGTINELVEAWDFGSNPATHCSYSYHMPYPPDRMGQGFPMLAVSPPDAPVCADRNPFLDKNAETYAVSDDPWSYVTGPELDDDEGYLNAASHQREGQNVLYNDSHVTFEKQSNVGIQKDNLWMHWGTELPNTQTMQVGDRALAPTGQGDKSAVPWSEKDAMLISDSTLGN